MLYLRRILPPRRETLELHEHVPFVVEWPGAFSGSAYWRITSDAELLQIGVSLSDGAIASIEMPLFGGSAQSQTDWPVGLEVEAGHPCFSIDPDDDETYRDDPRLRATEVVEAPSSIAVRWEGWERARRAVRSGRVVFACDAEQALCGFALVELSAAERSAISSALARR